MTDTRLISTDPFAQSKAYELPQFPKVLAPVIYFLIKSGNVVYVGQCLNGLRRVAEHMFDPCKEFDSFSYYTCAEGQLTLRETVEICRYRPIYNKTIAAPPGHTNASEVRLALQRRRLDIWHRFVEEVAPSFEFKGVRLYCVQAVNS